MTATARLKDLALSESGFVFDPYSGATFTANATGLAVLRSLREGLNRPQIVERLRDEFLIDGAATHLDSDVGEFLRLLVQQSLVPPDFENEATPTHSAAPALPGAQP